MQGIELAMMSSTGAFLWPMMSLPVLIYLITRWRVYREQAPADPQLGLKVAICFFRMLGLQLALLGLALALWGLLQGDDEGGSTLRVGIGFLLPGILLFVVHALALGKTNDADFPTVGRMFAGATMVFDGLVATAALVGLSVLGLAKSAPAEVLRLLFTSTLVFGTAWGVLALRLVKRLRAPAA